MLLTLRASAGKRVIFSQVGELRVRPNSLELQLQVRSSTITIVYMPTRCCALT